MKKCLCLTGLIAVLTACSTYNETQYASNDKKQYLKSSNGQTLVVPPPLTSSNIGSFYDLPAQNQRANISIVPPV